MDFKLRPVRGFGQWPDGRLRAGPFVVEHVGALHRLMDLHGLRPGTSGDVAMVSQTVQGMMISAQGPGVHGYFLDHEAIEVGRSDMDEFILAAVPAGSVCEISGHWCPDETRMVTTTATAMHDGRWVDWTGHRQIIHADGRVQQIGEDHGGPMARRARFRLVQSVS